VRLIKRYKNRKLYDTEERRYISHHEIADLIRENMDVKVVDKATGEDITNYILTQIVLEQSKAGQGLFPTESLADMIRWGSQTAHEYFNAVRQKVTGLFPPFLATEEKRDEMDELKERLAKLEKMIKKMEK